MNIRSIGVDKVHFFTPVIGDYDKLAIKFGYQEAPGLPFYDHFFSVTCLELFLNLAETC